MYLSDMRDCNDSVYAGHFLNGCFVKIMWLILCTSDIPYFLHAQLRGSPSPSLESKRKKDEKRENLNTKGSLRKTIKKNSLYIQDLPLYGIYLSLVYVL